MENKKLYLFKFIISYLILVLIFKHMNILGLPDFSDLNRFFIVYFLISYFIVKYLFYKDILKYELNREEYLKYIIVIYTIINIISGMPVIYDISLIIMLIIYKDKKSRIEDTTNKNIKKYFEEKNKK